MLADNLNGPTPSVSEISNPNTPLSIEHKPTISERLRDLRAKIEDIFTRREQKDQPPQQTLQDLAAVEIPQDTEKPVEPSPKEIDIPDTTSQDQQEISSLIQQIQQPQPESSPSPELTPKKLFPDRPSLYEQHYEEYNKERKTIKGKITQFKDIVALKITGVEKAAHTYNGLRSRGITRDQIMKNDTGKFPRISRILKTNWSIGIKEYQKPSYIDLPKNIDRLYSIGEFDLDSFSSDEKFSNTALTANSISHRTDKQFRQTREKLNNFSFLSGSNILHFFYKKKLPPDTFNAFSYLQKEYFSDPQNEAKFELFLSKRHLLKDDLFSGLNHEITSSGITDLVKTLISSGVNGDKKIEIPSELLKFCQETELDFIHCLLNINDRQQQRFFCEKIANLYSQKNFIENYFDSNLQPNLKFYTDYIQKAIEPGAPVVIPEKLLQDISSPEGKERWEFISKLPDRIFQEFAFSNHIYGDKYLSSNGQPNYLFYRRLLQEGDYSINSINPDYLKGLSPEQSKTISFAASFDPNVCLSAFDVRQFIFTQINTINKYLSSDGSITLKFLLDYFKSEYSVKIYPELLKTIILPENKSYLLSIINNNPTPENLSNVSSDSTKNNDQFDSSGFLIGKIFQEKYKNQPSRLLTPIGLCAWRVFNDYIQSHPNQEITSEIYDYISHNIDKEISQKLKFVRNSELDIPPGLRVSLGTEIEVVFNGLARTNKITNEEITDYSLLLEKQKKRPSNFFSDFIDEVKNKIYSAEYEYSKQVEYVTGMGVGVGKDAVHEFANLPVTNYATLLWELSEISNLGFLNFDRKFLQNIERGIHLTISGENTGISLDCETYLLQNALLISGFSGDALDGIGASQVVDSVDDESNKLYNQIFGYIRGRDTLKTPVFENSLAAHGVENRALRINSFNHLARTLLYTNRLIIPLKAYQEFTHMADGDKEEKLVNNITQLVDTDNNLNQIIKNGRNLLPDSTDEKRRNAVLAWAYFRTKTLKNFAEKQSNIAKFKLAPPNTLYSDRDMTRVGAELFHVYGGFTDTGEILPDALAAYHKSANPNSLPESERETILEVSSYIGRLFKKTKSSPQLV